MSRRHKEIRYYNSFDIGLLENENETIYYPEDSDEEDNRNKNFIQSLRDEANILYIKARIQNEQFQNVNNQPKKRNRVLGVSYTSEPLKRTKNIVKNYGNAIASFALSDLSIPYIETLLFQEEVPLEEFREFVSKEKEGLTCLSALRNILQEKKQDSEREKAYKRIFRGAGLAFVKYFSVNWIYHSKMKYRDAHLKFRFRMMRRIQNPELFTYLKGNI
jgi:hypothetical protein